MPYGSGYGMGGFGGSGVGGSIAQGLHAGFEMGRQVDADKAAREQREFENQRQTEADARAQQAADIATAHQGYLATNQLLANHRARGNALAEQYGGPTQVPEGIGEQYRQEGQGYLDTQKGHLQKIAGYVAAGKQQAQDDATNMAAGKLDPLSDKYPAKQLVHAFTATTRRPITDLLRGPNGEPAPVEQAGDDLHNGIKFGNEGMVLKAANTLFAPELQTGVGQPSPHGGTIIGKQIVKILPAPSDPNNPNDPNAGKVTPVIRVFVREGGGGDENYGNEGRNVQGPEQLQYGAPAGATGHYDAPVTQNRSTDPSDPIAHISMEDAMNRVEQLKAAAGSIAGDPRLRAKVDKGIEEGGTQHNTFLNAYRAIGGTMPGATYEDIKVPTLRLTKDAQGNVIKQTEFVPPAKELPETEAKAPSLHNVIQGTQEQTMQWNSKTKQYEPLGKPGPRFKPAEVPAGTGTGLANTITPANKDLHGDELLATLDPLTATKVKGVADGTIDPKDISERKDQRSVIVALAAKYKQDYSGKDFKTATATEKAFSTGKEAQKVRAFNVALDHLDAYMEAAKALKNGDAQAINKVWNYLAEKTGKAAPTNFETMKDLIADEVVNGIVGGTNALADRAKAAENLKRASSPEQFAGQVASLQRLMGGQLSGLAQQYSAGGGQKDFNTFLTPRARGFIHVAAPAARQAPTKTPAGATVSNW